jgi:hypothetical protein
MRNTSGVAPVALNRCGVAARSSVAGNEATCRCATRVVATRARAARNDSCKYA